MFYYKIVKKNEGGDDVCTSVIMTESKNKNPEYQKATKEEFENALNKKLVKGKWVEVEEEISEEKALQIIEESQAKIKELENTIIELSGKVDFQKRAK